MNRQRKKAVLYILIAGFSIAFIGALLFLWIFFSSMREMHQTTRNLYEKPFTNANAVLQLQNRLYQIRDSLLVATLTHARGGALDDSIAFIYAQDQLMKESLGVIRRSDAGELQIRELEARLESLDQARDQVQQKLISSRYVEADRLMTSKWSERFADAIQVTDILLSQANISANHYVLESQKRLEKHTKTGLVYAGLLLILFIVVSVFVVWRIYQLHIETDRFAFTDFLTGIANRRHFMQELESEIRRYERYATPFSFAMVDIDHFKKINDQFGHDTGDQVLQNFCLKCVNALRTSDMVGRLGGEEFGILMPMTDLHEAARVIERLRAEIDHSVMIGNDQQIHYTASFGLVSTSQKRSQYTLGIMMKAADAALYAAKQQGRNRVYISTEY